MSEQQPGLGAIEGGDDAAADDAVEAAIARVRAVYAGWGRDTPIQRMREDWERLFAPTMAARTRDIDAHGVACRWLAAPGVSTQHVIVYLHGGGFQLGSVRSHHDLMARLSAFSGAQLLGVDYRRAPESRFPAALEDGMRVMRWLSAQGFDATRVALAGDSAGGGLALAMLLAMQSEGLPMPAAALLMSAWTDMTAEGASYREQERMDPFHERSMMLALARRYLGADQDPAHPLASPLRASARALGALPPLLLQVGAREVLLSDSQELAARVVAAGGDARCDVWPGMFHVFQQFLDRLPQARAALRAAGAFMSARLGTAACVARTQP